MKDFDQCIDIPDFLTQIAELAKVNEAYGLAVVLYCKGSVGSVQFNATKDDLALGATALHLLSTVKDEAKLH